MKMPAAAIREEILKTGAISFARFMELALYCPETGYYETNKDTVGRRGDFVTSVSAGSLFGGLLAFQFGEWLEKLNENFRSAPVPGAATAPSRDALESRESSDNESCSARGRAHSGGLRIVEAGAHDGTLAADILNWLQLHRAKLFSEIEYAIIEPSPRRRAWQQEKLRSFGPRVRWHEGFATLQRCHGILFSNELLDAFPVRRLGWDATKKEWFEWGVALAGEKFMWTRITPAAATLDLPSALLAVLPDGYTIEVSPAAQAWWREAAGILDRGKLLTIDYGYTAGERFSPVRTRGTLRAYFHHHVSDDLLANPGEQDLTAHVNFSAVQEVGEEAGLKTEMFCTQPQFLTRILQRAVAENPFANLDAKQARQFQTLTHPEHLGRAFCVLVQAR